MIFSTYAGNAGRRAVAPDAGACGNGFRSDGFGVVQFVLPCCAITVEIAFNVGQVKARIAASFTPPQMKLLEPFGALRGSPRQWP